MSPAAQPFQALGLEIVIMAAGKGTRMRSNLPKVLMPLAGKPLLHHVIETAQTLQPRQTVVITGHQSAVVETSLSRLTLASPLRCVLQSPQLGTGHAVQQAAPLLADDSLVLVLSGDVPMVQGETLLALQQCSAGQALALLTLQLNDPTGYGRVIKQGEAVQRIVEEKDATPEEKTVREIYSGMMIAPARLLKTWLAQLRNDNVQQEYYLTDVVARAVQQGVPVKALCITDADQVSGINSAAQLADMERRFQLRTAQALMEQGVRLADPARLDVRGTLQCGRDVEIDVGCVFEGKVSLGDQVKIGPYCVIKNSHISSGSQLQAFCHVEGSSAGENTRIGPYARLRPGSQLAQNVHIGNFVEIKNSTLGPGAKANHLAYLGDAEVGARVNYGAGSITANYDGANKHRTIIGDDVHVGSNCVLVAPLTLGAGGTVGAGSTVTRSTPETALTVARGRQTTFSNWSRPQKKPR